MIKIDFPNNNITERTYIIDVLFKEFLGLDCKIVPTDKLIDKYTITIENGSTLNVEDHFFRFYSEDNPYLKDVNIPNEIFYTENEFLPEKNIPIIFGNSYFKKNNKNINCGLDIFASSFFMLTRWEEAVSSEKDMHQRATAESSLARKGNFLYRPVVNEMTEFLWNMLCFMGFSGRRIKKKYQLIPTHDIDLIKYPFFFRRLLGDIIKRKNYQLMLKRLSYMLRIKNPFNTYDFLMSISERHNVLSYFYFINGGKYKYDGNYSILGNSFLKICKSVQERGHIIGYHPSYYTFNNSLLWANEKKSLEKVVNINVIEGRQHYLRFETPLTWEIANENGLQIDSSMCYHDNDGFRCGTGDEFHVFNVLTRKKLNLKERPLVVMDETLRGYRQLTPDKAQSVLEYYKEISKKYKMKYTILFHNSSFDEVDWLGWKEVYKNIF